MNTIHFILGRIVNDGKLHNVEIIFSSKTTLTVDSKPDVTENTTINTDNWRNLLKTSGLSLGKTAKSFISRNFLNISYKGCLEKIMLGQRLLRLNESTNYGVRTGCHSDNQCGKNTCLNSGKCVDTFDSFECACPKHYTGTACNMTANVTCSFVPNPCGNNSMCTNLTVPVTRKFSDVGMDFFQCKCNKGYSRYFCNQNINECAANPCVHGNCTDLIADYRCTCVRGFTGKNCSVNIDDCNPNPCKNAASCKDGVNNYTCSCVEGYTGRNCTEDINECLKNPCKNNGTCLNLDGGYNCTCYNGTSGKQCQYNASMACMSNPCQNGICTADHTGYKCKCQAGFVGSRCQTNTNPCASTPCANQGICVPNLSQCSASMPNCVRTYVSYNCTCVGQWTGSDCKYVKPCARSPCLNGASCSTNTNTAASKNYTCQCTSEYQGDECQEKKPVKAAEVNVPMWIGIAIAIVVLFLAILLACRFCKGQQGMHGVYSPSRQEKGQVEMTSLPPLPPKERLI